MKTGAEGYAEVQAMKKVDVLSIIRKDASEAWHERYRIKGEKDAQDASRDSDRAFLILAELIEAAKVLVDACNPETKGWDLTVSILGRIA